MVWVMVNSIEVNVVPDVFKWLRESAGWSYDDVSKRIKIDVNCVKNVETGNYKLTFNQLQTLANCFKRPVASFLLSKPISEKTPPKDYRMLPNKVNTFDKKTIIVLRKARNLQDICKDLINNINDKLDISFKYETQKNDAVDVGKKYRKLFDLDAEKQKKFKDAYKLYDYLRDILETNNIFVFQFSMPIEDARGFVLTDDVPKVIVVNTKDIIEARIFTLIHELGHILLGESAIDLPNNNTLIVNNKTEQWCNEFASSFLLPSEILNQLFESKSITPLDIIKSENLKRYSRYYKISKAMFLYNLYRSRYITSEEYNSKLNLYVVPMMTKTNTKTDKKIARMALDKKCFLEMGNKFVSLVADNYEHKQINYNDALGYLSIKSKNFEKVLMKAKK